MPKIDLGIPDWFEWEGTRWEPAGQQRAGDAAAPPCVAHPSAASHQSCWPHPLLPLCLPGTPSFPAAHLPELGKGPVLFLAAQQKMQARAFDGGSKSNHGSLPEWGAMDYRH